MNYSQLDKELIWHPFTHLKYQKKNIVIKKAKGIYLIDENNKKYIDGIGSWWVNVHGHSHPYIAKKIKQQLNIMEHCIFSGFTHPPAVILATEIAKIIPIKNPKVFFSDNGSTSVEVAIKMALQYHHNLNHNKHIIIALKGAYHGDTFGGMSVAERNVFNKPFEKLLFKTEFIDIPNEQNIHSVKKQLQKILQKNNVAAFIFEPLIQGAAGMKTYSAHHLDELIAMCKKHSVICIADEVFTGFGKTGELFASNYLKNKPNIMCLSKGLTGGFLPLGLTVASKFIYTAFIKKDKTKTFFHGHSYTANPLACAAAIANIELINKASFIKKINHINTLHLQFFNQIKNHKHIKEIRCLGIILAIEVKTKTKSGYLNELSEDIESFFIQRNILLRPLGNVLYIVPPICITKKELQKIYYAIVVFLNHLK